MDWKYLLTSFDGRIGRKSFWLGNLVIFLIGLVLAAVNTPIAFKFEYVGDAVSAIGTLALIYLQIALSAKRWHDRGKSGWWTLIGFVPVIGLWMLVECGFLRGTPGDNQYGPDPLRF